MVVDGPLGQLGGVDNVLEGGLVVALLEKEGGRSVQNVGDCLLRVLVPGHSGPLLSGYRPAVCIIVA